MTGGWKNPTGEEIVMGLLKYTAETTGLDIETLTRPIPESVAGAFSASAVVRSFK